MRSRVCSAFLCIFVAVMLAAAGSAAYTTVVKARLEAECIDLTGKLDLSRQRERKQTYEYEQVVAAIPETEAALQAALPLAEAANATVTDLKAQRKALREEIADTEAALAAAKAELTALCDRLDALADRLAALQP